MRLYHVLQSLPPIGQLLSRSWVPSSYLVASRHDVPFVFLERHNSVGGRDRRFCCCITERFRPSICGPLSLWRTHFCSRFTVLELLSQIKCDCAAFCTMASCGLADFRQTPGISLEDPPIDSGDQPFPGHVLRATSRPYQGCNSQVLPLVNTFDVANTAGENPRLAARPKFTCFCVKDNACTLLHIFGLVLCQGRLSWG